MPATTTLPNTPTRSPVSTDAGAVQRGQGTSRSRGGSGVGGASGGGVTRGGGTLDIAPKTLGRELGQARDRPHARNRRSVGPADQDRLDPGRPGAGHVLVERVADVDRVGGRHAGELEGLLEDRRRGLARAGAGRGDD